MGVGCSMWEKVVHSGSVQHVKHGLMHSVKACDQALILVVPHMGCLLRLCWMPCDLILGGAQSVRQKTFAQV